MMEMRRVSWFVYLLVGLAFSICYSSVRVLAAETEAALVEGAKKEGKLYIYHSFNVLGYGLRIKAFKQKYPFITVESFRAPAPKLLIRALAEASANRHVADIFDVRGFEINILKEKGLMMKYSPPNLRFIPREFIDPDSYYWGNSYAVQSVAYNTKLVPQHDIPKNFEELLNPRWKGKMFVDERDYEWYANMLTFMGKEKGLEYMKKLSRQAIQFRFGKRLLATLLAAGEAQLFLTASGHTIEEYRENGAPVRWLPFNPTMGQMDSIGIMSHASSPNAAKLYCDFIASKEGQDTISSTTGMNPIRADSKRKYPELDVTGKGYKLFLSSVTVDYSKFDKEFRAMFMLK